MECKIGLVCDWKECPNQKTCEIWANPWPLPYVYRPGRGLMIEYRHHFQRVSLLIFEDLKIDLIEEWQAYGFYEAITLPYVYEPGKLIVCLSHESGFRRGLPLPYIKENSQLIVKDVCVSALEAGWADAWSLDIPF